MVWATVADAVNHWSESDGLDETDLTALLEAAHRSCATYAPALTPRTFADAVTTDGSTLVTSATGLFSSTDIGRVLAGTGIPEGATVSEVYDCESVALSVPAIATATAVSVSVSGVPFSYTLAVVYQARDVWTAQQRGDSSSDVVGVGDFGAVRARPLSAVVRQLLRPLGAGSFLVG